MLKKNSGTWKNLVRMTQDARKKNAHMEAQLGALTREVRRKTPTALPDFEAMLRFFLGLRYYRDYGRFFAYIDETRNTQMWKPHLNKTEDGLRMLLRIAETDEDQHLSARLGRICDLDTSAGGDDPPFVIQSLAQLCRVIDLLRSHYGSYVLHDDEAWLTQAPALIARCDVVQPALLALDLPDCWI